MESRLPQELLSRIEAGGPILALTGAGVSAESGLATFRGPGGLWEGHDPMSLATPAAFAAEPETVWRFYRWRRQQAASARPNAGHLALAALARSRAGVRVVTQNVDGLHERAGSRDVVRLHGSLWRLRCTAEGGEIDDARTEFDPFPPRCACGALLRPAVVWFGEPLDPAAWQAAEQLARTATIVLVAGTSSLVWPAAGLPGLAAASGAYVVEINPEPTPITPSAALRLAVPSGQALPALARAAGVTEDLATS
jgi:NAD-dependent deacetylase